MSTKTLIYLAIIAGIIYYVYQRKKKQQEAQKTPGNGSDSTSTPSTATPPIVPTFKDIDPADFEKQAFEVV